jgi:hypothetical protein
VLASLGLFLLAARPAWRAALPVAGVAGALAAAVALSGLSGYFTGVERAYGWNPTRSGDPHRARAGAGRAAAVAARATGEADLARHTRAPRLAGDFLPG